MTPLSECALTMRQIDQARTDFALIEDHLEFIAEPARQAADSRRFGEVCARDHLLHCGTHDNFIWIAWH